MAARRTKLSDRSVLALPLPETGRQDVWDTITPGFGVRLHASGSRTWIALVGGNRHVVGKFPQMGVAEARKAAQKVLGAPPTPRGDLFQAGAERFLEHGLDRRGRPWRTNTIRLYRFVLMSAAAPLHKRRVAEVTRADVAEVLHQVATSRGVATAALARSALHRFFEYLISVGAIEFNPAARSPIYSVEPRKHVLDDGELRAIWHGPDTQFRTVVRLLLLTAARRSEVGGMKWSEIDFDTGIWTCPAERVKTKHELVLPLPAAALAEIERQPRLPGRDVVFGGGSPKGLTEWGQAKARFDKAVPLARAWRLHDCRRSARTRLHKLHVSPDLVKRILNHDLGLISAAYDQHDYLDEMREALELWSTELGRIVSEPHTEVVQLRPDAAVDTS